MNIKKISQLSTKKLLASILLASSFFTHELNSMNQDRGTSSPNFSSNSRRTPSPRFMLGACRRPLTPQEFIHKFFVIEEHILYRSQRLKPLELETYLKNNGIKTVVNLCGKEENATWWKEEKEMVEQNVAKLIDILFIDGQLQTKEDILMLLDVFDNAEKPILIHCNAGVDRTGLAVALWMIDKRGEPLEEALKCFISIKQDSAEFLFLNIWQGRGWLENFYGPAMEKVYNIATNSIMEDLFEKLESSDLENRN